MSIVFENDSLNYDIQNLVASGMACIFDWEEGYNYEIAFKYYTDTKELFIFNLMRGDISLPKDIREQLIGEIIKFWNIGDL